MKSFQTTYEEFSAENTAAKLLSELMSLCSKWLNELELKKVRFETDWQVEVDLFVKESVLSLIFSSCKSDS